MSEPGLLPLRVAARRHDDRLPQPRFRQPPGEHGHHLTVAHAVEPRGVRGDRPVERTAHLVHEPGREHRVHALGDTALERIARQREMNVPRTHRTGRARVLLPPAQAASREQRHLDRARGPLLTRSEEHTSELQSLAYLVCRLLLEKKKDHTVSLIPHRLPHIPALSLCVLYL